MSLRPTSALLHQRASLWPAGAPPIIAVNDKAWPARIEAMCALRLG